MPKISIIVPVYNVEEYLDRCMKSLLNQTLIDLEIILVDDGSPDNCPQMCDEYAINDNRVRVIHKQNAGLGYARNSGLDIANGDYVAFVDSDDYVENSMYESLVLEAEKSGADAVFCKFYTEQVDGTWSDRNEVCKREEWNNNQIHNFLFDIIASAPGINEERKYSMSVWHSIYRRKIIEANKIRFYSERDIMSEDIPFQVDFLLKSKKMVYIPVAYYYYCLNKGSLTTTFKYEKYERMKSLYHLLNKKLSDFEGHRLRTDRFFIGYVRSFMLSMYYYNYKEKRKMIKSICEDNIWIGIYTHYRPSYLPPYPKLIYILIVKRKVIILDIILMLINYIKKMRGRR